MNLLKRIMPKDSFYLILFVCVTILGSSAVWVSKERTNLSERLEAKEEMIEQEIELDLTEKDVAKRVPKEVKKDDIEKIESEPKIIEKKQEQPKKESLEKPVEKQQGQVEQKQQKEKSVQSTEQSEAVASNQVEVKKIKLKKPVEGRIYKDFAHDKLVYSKTLDEWSTHLGVDIGASAGTNVVAPLDGIVKSIENDKKLGIKIVIDHGNGLETVYKNVSTDKEVKIGQKVKTGDIISKVSKGMGFEKLDEPHLHFEVLQSGKNVDPKNFF